MVTADESTPIFASSESAHADSIVSPDAKSLSDVGNVLAISFLQD